MAEHNALDVKRTLDAIEALVQNGLRSPHTEPVSALEMLASSLTSLVSAAHTGIARIRAAQNMRASGAARLSQEAITIIVLLLDKFEDRLTVCHVCRLWRTVALDIPAPWPTFTCGAYAKSIAGSGKLKHIEADYDHCPGDIEEPLCVIDSNLERLSLLHALPGSAGFSVQLELEAHCDGAFAESPHTPTEDVRNQVLQALQTLNGEVTREMLSAAFSFEDKLFLDALHPLVTLADRISSLTLEAQCKNWLTIFLCVPPMTMLHSLTVTSWDDTEVLSLPDALLRVLATASTPELPVAFPKLHHLKICDVEFEPTPDVLSSRVASLLRTMPELRSLELLLPSWPAIDSSAVDSSRAVLQLGGHGKLESIVLGSGGHYDPGDRDCSSFDELLNALPVAEKCSIEYHAARCASYDAVFAVLTRAKFIPTALTAIYSPKTQWESASLCIEATDTSGSRRVVHADGSCSWSGQGLAKHVSAARLSSLTLNIAALGSLADGFAARALERLEIVLHASDLRFISQRPVKVEFALATEPTHRMHLPALTTLAFGVHQSLWDELERHRITDPRIPVPVSVLVAAIRAVLPPGGLVERLVIGKGIRPTGVGEGADTDPIAELKTMTQSLVML